MEGMFEGTGPTKLNLDKDPQSTLKDKIGKFDEVDLQKSYAWAQVKYDERVTITVISRQIVFFKRRLDT